MRSSKSRSRNKQRNRSVGNIVNRVFDSSGPEGKVRGTPQQIIDKYNQLARDAQLGGDRVATENFYQHAEHYTRMLAEAQREQNERREQHEQQQQQHRERQQQRDQQGQEREEASGEAQQPQQSPQGQPETAKDSGGGGRQQDRGERAAKESSADVIDFGGDDGDTGLVETPEEKPKRKPRARKPKQTQADDGGEASNPAAAE